MADILYFDRKLYSNAFLKTLLNFCWIFIQNRPFPIIEIKSKLVLNQLNPILHRGRGVKLAERA